MFTRGFHVSTPRPAGLWTLIQFLIELMQRRAWVTVTITMQRGELVTVHVNESHKLADLPIRDRTGQAAIAAGGQRLIGADTKG